MKKLSNDYILNLLKKSPNSFDERSKCFVLVHNNIVNNVEELKRILTHNQDFKGLINMLTGLKNYQNSSFLETIISIWDGHKTSLVEFLESGHRVVVIVNDEDKIAMGFEDLKLKSSAYRFAIVKLSPHLNITESDYLLYLNVREDDYEPLEELKNFLQLEPVFLEN